MGIPLLVGRVFTEHDAARSARVVLINETLARKFWPNPNDNPLGRHITMKDWGPPLNGEIVGVVGDVKGNGLDASVGPMLYWPYRQFGQIFNRMVVRTDGDPLRFRRKGPDLVGRQRSARFKHSNHGSDSLRVPRAPPPLRCADRGFRL